MGLSGGWGVNLEAQPSEKGPVGPPGLLGLRFSVSGKCMARLESSAIGLLSLFPWADSRPGHQVPKDQCPRSASPDSDSSWLLKMARGWLYSLLNSLAGGVLLRQAFPDLRMERLEVSFPLSLPDLVAHSEGLTPQQKGPSLTHGLGTILARNQVWACGGQTPNKETSMEVLSTEVGGGGHKVRSLPKGMHLPHEASSPGQHEVGRWVKS